MNNRVLLKNLVWKFGERISAQLISIVVSIILARLLSPSDYGVVSIVMVFITLANVFVSNGFGSALVQKKGATALDFFSVLYFNISFSFFLYLILYIVAPYISAFYGKGYEILTPVLRVLGIKIVLTAINSVQQAYISKKMMFQKFFFATIWGTIASAIVGISMAYLGYGVWALVAQDIVSITVSTLTLTIVIGKKPQICFSFTSLKQLFPYGIRILGTGMLINGCEELKALIIGKKYSSSDLAYYDKGRQFPNLIINNVDTSISSVLFPKMSDEQDDKVKLKETTRTSIRFSSYIMCPIMLGLAAVAEPFIKILLTEKWMDSVFLLRVFCIAYLLQPMHVANIQAIKALGRSDIYLKLEIIKKVIELIVLLITMWVSVEAIVIGIAICATLFAYVNAYPNIRLLDYSWKEQMRDILPNVIISIIMCVCVYALTYLPINDFIKLLIQVLAGIVIYIVLSIISQNSVFISIKKLIESTLCRR